MRYPNLVNRAALTGLFEHAGLDALFANSPKNVFYLSGCPTALPDVHMTPYYNPALPSAAVVLALPDGESILFVSEDDVAVNRERAWSSVRSVAAWPETPVERLAAELSSRSLEDAIVGFEDRSLPASMCSELRALLPRLRLVPVDEGLERVRNRKIPAEVELIKRSADLLDEAIRMAFSEARPGDTERQLHSAIIANSLDLGAQYCRGAVQAGDNLALSFGGSSDRRLRQGDLVFTDYAAFLDGYPSNQSRHATVGAPSDEHRRMYGITIDVQRRLIDYMRPGVTGRDVFLRCNELIVEHGLKPTAPLAGHSLGPGYHERPLIIATEDMALAEDNVIAIEPMLPPYSRYTVQDLVLIKESGNVLLSDGFNTDELFVIG